MNIKENEMLKVNDMMQMNDIIQMKETELKNMLQFRNQQLETLCKSREELLIQSLTKFEALKEDFEYNLSLIDARDYDIKRLESVVEEEKRKRQECLKMAENISKENEMLKNKETELIQKLEQQKATHRVYKCYDFFAVFLIFLI
jgi:uncharacterized HAD superfamily protein